MTRIVRVAVLECDIPLDPVTDRYGKYGVIFKRLLTAGLQELGAADVELQTTGWDVMHNQVYPRPEEFDALLLTGSIELTNYVRDIFEHHKKPIVGICFGHQIVARALGARVGRNDAGWEISVEPFTLSDAGKQLFSQDTLMHRDIVYEVPQGCVGLGSSPLCEVQGFYMPQRVLSVQGHPEFDEFITTSVIETRHKAGVFDDDLAKDGLSRAGKHHDGTVFAKAACKFILG
ncbi:hypothetical protein BBP40_001982 [Aspergillus hancockii]|nr:hypothetical protein BBP40_001982 [Aspergillus hancockii]